MRGCIRIVGALLVAAMGCQRISSQRLPSPPPVPVPPPTNHADAVTQGPSSAPSEVDALVDQYEHPQPRAFRLNILKSLRQVNSEEALAALGALFSMEKDSVLQ